MVPARLRNLNEFADLRSKETSQKWTGAPRTRSPRGSTSLLPQREGACLETTFSRNESGLQRARVRREDPDSRLFLSTSGLRIGASVPAKMAGSNENARNLATPPRVSRFAQPFFWSTIPAGTQASRALPERSPPGVTKGPKPAPRRLAQDPIAWATATGARVSASMRAPGSSRPRMWSAGVCPALTSAISGCR